MSNWSALLSHGMCNRKWWQKTWKVKMLRWERGVFSLQHLKFKFRETFSVFISMINNYISLSKGDWKCWHPLCKNHSEGIQYPANIHMCGICPPPPSYPISSFKFLTFISWNIPWWDHFRCPTLWAQIEADPVYKLKTWYFVTISMMRTNSATLYKGECNCHHDRKLANCFAWVRVC